LPLDADPQSMTDPKRYGTHVSSFLQDLRAGRPLELNSTILAVRDIARAKGIAAPSLTAVAAIVAAMSADRSAPVGQN
jgi:ketopantoate reductase